MRLEVDRESDALYFRLDESAVVESEEVQLSVPIRLRLVLRHEFPQLSYGPWPFLPYLPCLKSLHNVVNPDEMSSLLSRAWKVPDGT